MSPRQITIKMRGIAPSLTPEVNYLNRLTDGNGVALTLISPEVIVAARTCPAAALKVQLTRSARDLKIYQTALTIAQLLAQQLTEIEDLAIAKGSDQ